MLTPRQHRSPRTQRGQLRTGRKAELCFCQAPAVTQHPITHQTPFQQLLLQLTLLSSACFR